VNFAWWGTVVAAVYLYLNYDLALFPWTRGFAKKLLAFALDPIRTLASGFVKSLPNIIFLVVLFFVARYLLRLVRLFFDGLATERFVLKGFDPEWSWPTYRLVRLLFLMCVVVVAYPYVPGAGSDAFKGVTLFVGIIFSLGSSSLMGNFIAGYSMTYRRAFRVGDRVKIGANIGDVERMRLLVTHLRTLKNEELVVPNSNILNTEIINYSSLARERGLILHTVVGIGYETPWRQVEAMLYEAAGRTPGLLREPAPYVLQLALADFCVNYELNVYCGDPKVMETVYTDLHRSVLDVFNKYNVQIMTPAYRGDPAEPKVVPRDQWYLAPAKPPDSQQAGA
jgi:small-conductance mechanosensitive channel